MPEVQAYVELPDPLTATPPAAPPVGPSGSAGVPTVAPATPTVTPPAPRTAADAPVAETPTSAVIPARRQLALEGPASPVGVEPRDGRAPWSVLARDR